MITVRDTIAQAAELLGLAEGVRLFLAGEDSENGEKDTALLLDCFQRVENELASDYLPLIEEEEMVTSTGIIPYEDFGRVMTRIYCVEDEWGKPLKYKRFFDRLQTQSGKVKIIYGYKPEGKGLEDTSDYYSTVSERLFAYGIAAEYSLIIGETENAAIWDKKYKAAIEAAYRARPCKRLRARRWA